MDQLVHNPEMLSIKGISCASAIPHKLYRMNQAVQLATLDVGEAARVIGSAKSAYVLHLKRVLLAFQYRLV